jgi:DNA-binding NtrC family response regulator
MPHILIVEDETIIRSALRRLLERNQYQVSEAGSVQEAQERFSIPTFDLIVSDLRLPGAPGTELIKLGQGTPVLIMTSYASLRSAVDSMKMGAVDYIAKPSTTTKCSRPWRASCVTASRRLPPAKRLPANRAAARKIVRRQQQWRNRHHRLLPADAGPVQQDPQSRADRLQCADPGRVRHR